MARLEAIGRVKGVIDKSPYFYFEVGCECQTTDAFLRSVGQDKGDNGREAAEGGDGVDDVRAGGLEDGTGRDGVDQ